MFVVNAVVMLSGQKIFSVGSSPNAKQIKIVTAYNPQSVVPRCFAIFIILIVIFADVETLTEL